MQNHNLPQTEWRHLESGNETTMQLWPIHLSSLSLSPNVLNHEVGQDHTKGFCTPEIVASYYITQLLYILCMSGLVLHFQIQSIKIDYSPDSLQKE